MSRKISKSDFLLQYQELDNLRLSLSVKEEYVENYALLLNAKKNTIDEYHLKYNLPKLSFAILGKDPNKTEDDSQHSYLRCVATYDFAGLKNRLSINVGKVLDFPDWEINEGVLKIVVKKLSSHLLKRFGNISKDGENIDFSYEGMLKRYLKVKELKFQLLRIKNQVDNQFSQVVEKTEDIKKLKNEYVLPDISISLIQPQLEKIKDKNHSISTPHLRGMATIEIGNVKRRLVIFIGKIEDFPQGVNDPKAIEIARVKLFSHLLKNFDFKFCE
jgi:hypothetical protein